MKNEKNEPYRYQEGGSTEMLVNLLITCDGRGPREKKKALQDLVARAAVDPQGVATTVDEFDK